MATAVATTGRMIADKGVIDQRHLAVLTDGQRAAGTSLAVTGLVAEEGALADGDGAMLGGDDEGAAVAGDGLVIVKVTVINDQRRTAGAGNRAAVGRAIVFKGGRVNGQQPILIDDGAAVATEVGVAEEAAGVDRDGAAIVHQRRMGAFGQGEIVDRQGCAGGNDQRATLQGDFVATVDGRGGGDHLIAGQRDGDRIATTVEGYGAAAGQGRGQRCCGTVRWLAITDDTRRGGDVRSGKEPTTYKEEGQQMFAHKSCTYCEQKIELG